MVVVLGSNEYGRLNYAATTRGDKRMTIDYDEIDFDCQGKNRNFYRFDPRPRKMIRRKNHHLNDPEYNYWRGYSTAKNKNPRSNHWKLKNAVRRMRKAKGR